MTVKLLSFSFFRFARGFCGGVKLSALQGYSPKPAGKKRVVKLSSKTRNTPRKAHCKGICLKKEFRLQNRMSRVQVLLPLPVECLDTLYCASRFLFLGFLPRYKNLFLYHRYALNRIPDRVCGFLFTEKVTVKCFVTPFANYTKILY